VGRDRSRPKTPSSRLKAVTTATASMRPDAAFILEPRADDAAISAATATAAINTKPRWRIQIFEAALELQDREFRRLLCHYVRGATGKVAIMFEDEASEQRKRQTSIPAKLFMARNLRSIGVKVDMSVSYEWPADRRRGSARARVRRLLYAQVLIFIWVLVGITRVRLCR
jgi:hypothetical protein